MKQRSNAGNSAVQSAARWNSAEYYRLIVAIFGVVWLFNAWFQFSAWVLQAQGGHPAPLMHVMATATKHAPAWLKPYPSWVAGLVGGIGPQFVAVIMVAIALFLGLAMIFRFKLELVAWVGIIYSLLVWVTICSLGYPYSDGGTDPGTLPVYTIAFVFVLAVAPLVDPKAEGKAQIRPVAWRAATLLFALLWVFIATLKWAPYFLTHFMEQLTPAVDGQPGWVAAYINAVIAIVRGIGPELVAVIVAVVETLLALSLLFGAFLTYSIPLGFLYCFAVWSSAEGFGGPYGPGGTGVRGDVLGNALLYMIIFLFLAVAHQAGRKTSAAAHRDPADVGVATWLRKLASSNAG
jgi:hypothetical protein